jgi:hypothetical protein
MTIDLIFSDCLRNEAWGPVLQYHFTAWPDFGVANSCKTVIDLVQTVKTKLGQNIGNYFILYLVQTLSM